MPIMLNPVVAKCVKEHSTEIKFEHAGYKALTVGRLYILPETVAQELQAREIVQIITAPNDNSIQSS